MKLVIDIPEDIYNRLKDDVIGCDDGGIIIKAIQNGKPLDILAEEAAERFKEHLESGFYHDRKGNPITMKEKPKMIILSDDSVCRYDYYKCPSCQSAIGDYIEVSYCPYCGQALKWEDDRK